MLFSYILLLNLPANVQKMNYSSIEEVLLQLLNDINDKNNVSSTVGKLLLCKSHESFWDLNNISKAVELLLNLFSCEQASILANTIDSIDKSDYSVGVIINENAPFEHFPIIYLASILNKKVIIKFTSKSDQLYNPLIQFFKEHNLGLFENVNFNGEGFKECDKYFYLPSNRDNSALIDYLNNRDSVIQKYITSALVIKGDESIETLRQIAPFVFNWFGRSQLSVHHIFVPNGYRVENILDAFSEYYSVMDNNKYANNYEYHRSVLLVNSIHHLDNGFILLKNDDDCYAPTGVIYFSEYNNIDNIDSDKYYNIYHLKNNETFRFIDVYTWSDIWNRSVFFNKLQNK